VETMNLQTGRMAVVVPHGVLFRGSSEGRIRQQLIEENLLDAVIGLPSNLFFGTGIPAAILVLRRDKVDDTVLFVDGSRAFADGKNQNVLRDEDIGRIVAAYRGRSDIDKFAYLAKFEEIQENDFNLNIPRYVDTFEEEKEIDIGAVQNEILELDDRLMAVRGLMEGYLLELGL
jgi:type I restriction enzyme M protein